MEKIKVYLQYPWKFPDSPYYQPLIQNPPNNVKFLNIEEQKGAITNKKKFWLSNSLKQVIRRTLSRFDAGVINAHSSPPGDYDLIHCAHCLSKNKNKPWVADFECGWQFFVGKENKKIREQAKDLILSPNCKGLLAWTEKTKQEMINIIPEIKDKIEVVYPAIPSQKSIKKKHDGINLVFVARYFHDKGGYHAIEVMKGLIERYNNVRGIIVSPTPPEIIKENKNNDKITFYPLMPQKEVFEKVYSIGDIFIYPGYADSFGFAIPEAMSFGMPVIGVNGYARKEVIIEGKTGFVADFPTGINNPCQLDWKNIGEREEPIIKKMTEKAALLINHKKLRETMSENCINEIKKGKFSIDVRNNKLGRIYHEAIK